MALSGIFGPQIWQQPFADHFGYRDIIGNVAPLDLWLPMIYVTFLTAHLPACVLNVVKARRRDGLPVAPVFLEWIPIIIFSLGCAGWLGSPHSHLLKDERLVLFCLTQSLVFGRMTTKIILAHLTRQPFPYWTVMLVPLVAGAIMINLPYLGLPAMTVKQELWYLRAYFVFALVAYSRWAILVVSSICDYLEINCLTVIPPREKTIGNSANTKKMK